MGILTDQETMLDFIYIVGLLMHYVLFVHLWKKSISRAQYFFNNIFYKFI